MPCEEQLKVYIGKHRHGYMITILTFLKTSHTEEELK